VDGVEGNGTVDGVEGTATVDDFDDKAGVLGSGGCVGFGGARCVYILEPSSSSWSSESLSSDSNWGLALNNVASAFATAISIASSCEFRFFELCTNAWSSRSANVSNRATSEGKLSTIACVASTATFALGSSAAATSAASAATATASAAFAFSAAAVLA